MKYLFALFSVLCAPSFAFQDRTDYPSLHTQGEDYINACKPTELAELRQTVLALTTSKNPDDAWLLISTLLCRTGPRAEAELQRHTPEKILFTSMDTGQDTPTRELKAPSESLLAERRVWSASVSDNAEGAINLAFLTGEACARSLSLRFNGKRWLIVKVDDGCD